MDITFLLLFMFFCLAIYNYLFSGHVPDKERTNFIFLSIMSFTIWFCVDFIETSENRWVHSESFGPKPLILWNYSDIFLLVIIFFYIYNFITIFNIKKNSQIKE